MDFFEIITKIIAANPPMALIFLLIGIAIWLIGENVLFALHYRRIGKPMWSALKPFANPVKDFNGREWLWFCIIGLIGCLFMSIALYGSAR